MFTFNAKTRDKGNIPSKGVVYGSHVLFDDIFTGIGTWKAVKAFNTYTQTVIPSNGETVTIDGKVYTFKTTITTASGDVAIGASLAAAQANLVAAINGDKVLVGTGYGSQTQPHPTVTASAFVANVSTITAKTGGTAGNSIATTDTCANGIFSGATLSGGVAETAADSILVPATDTYNAGSYSTIGQSLWSSGLSQSTSAIAKRYQRLASNYDDLQYTTGQIKKKMITNQFDARIKGISKIALNSILKENPAVTIGFNYSLITRIAQLDTNKFVIGNASAQLQVIQINTDGTVTVGALFTHSQTIQLFDCVDTGKIVGIRNIGATSYEAQYFSVSGTTISFVSASTITVTGSATTQQLNVRKISTGKAALVYRNNTTTYGMRIVDVTGALSVTASDTTITPATVGSSPELITYDTDKYAIICIGSGNVLQVFACNVTGTAMAVGSAYTSTNIISLDVNAAYDNFSAYAINTTNLVCTLYNNPTVAGLAPILEQVSISGTVVSTVKTFYIEASGTVTNSGVKIQNVATDTYGIYFSSISNISGRYDASSVMIPMTVSGSTVTLSNTWRSMRGLRTTPYFTNSRFTQKIGSYFVNLINTATTTAQLLVHIPCTIELYNFETLITTATTSYPFCENIVNLDGVAAGLVYDEVAYLKFKNTHAQTHLIVTTGVLVEME